MCIFAALQQHVSSKVRKTWSLNEQIRCKKLALNVLWQNNLLGNTYLILAYPFWKLEPFYDLGLFLYPLKNHKTRGFFMLPGCIEKDQWHDLGYILLKNRPSTNFWYTTNFFGPNCDKFCNFPIQKHFAKYTFKIAI